jgi:hypothetical protein
MKYRKLKGIKEINLSALARSAGIRDVRLTQAVGGYSYSTKYPNLTRKLSEDEQKRISAALSKLIEKINKILQS